VEAGECVPGGKGGEPGRGQWSPAGLGSARGMARLRSMESGPGSAGFRSDTLDRVGGTAVSVEAGRQKRGAVEAQVLSTGMLSASRRVPWMAWDGVTVIEHAARQHTSTQPRSASTHACALPTATPRRQRQGQWQRRARHAHDGGCRRCVRWMGDGVGERSAATAHVLHGAAVLYVAGNECDGVLH
jgi:hypothetical protein